ncbi:MAG: methyltransferase domain-containing protein [Candidatus Midichloria sp.]|nr:MAG: methyltransferase domain-containing protein [Candidatus Midichloria sp.]
MFLKQVQNSFDRSATSYESVAQIQKLIASTIVKETLDSVSNKGIKQVVDIGTGTGFVIEELLKYLPQAIYTANDLAAGMIKITKAKFIDFQNINYLIGDANTIDFKPSDLTISSMALQWFPDIKSILRKLYHQTELLSFSTLLKNNFSEWYAILSKFDISPPNFHTKKELEEICLNFNPSGYRFFNKSYMINFNNALEMVKYLKKLGANINNNGNQYSVKNLLDNYKEPIKTHYEVFFAILEK